MKVFFLGVFFVLLTINHVKSTMTEAQIKSAGKLMRNVCQPKTKVSSAQIDDMHKGEFKEEHNLMCYMECTLRMGQITKDGKLNTENIRSQMANLPPHLAEVVSGAVGQCKDSMKSSDKCTAAFEYYKCFYDYDPENFFFP